MGKGKERRERRMEAWSEERERQPGHAWEARERVVVQERRGTRVGQRAWELRKVRKVLTLQVFRCYRRQPYAGLLLALTRKLYKYDQR